MIALVLGLETIPDLQNTNSTHTGIAYAHLTAPHSCVYVGYVRHEDHAREAANNQMCLFGLEYAKFSLHEKWNKYLHPYQTVIA